MAGENFHYDKEFETDYHISDSKAICYRKNQNFHINIYSNKIFVWNIRLVNSNTNQF